MTALLNVERRWVCPNCSHTRVTTVAGRHAVIHTCDGLRGVIAPLVEEGTRCSVTLREREDYVCRDTPQTDYSGRPVMSVVTTRDDGQDCMILAPLMGSTAEAPYGMD